MTPRAAGKARDDPPAARAPQARESPGAAPALPRVDLSIRRRSRHPWIYRKMCRPASHAPGTLVEVWDRAGAFAGRGIYNRKSQIAVRLLTEDPRQPLDEAFLKSLLDRAIALRRETLRLDAVTDAYRIVHAEGDGLSGLVADRFGRFVVIELFSAGWFRQLRWLLPALSSRLGGATVLVRADRAVEEAEGFRVRDFTAARLGSAALRAEIREGPVRFRVDLERGHKTGFFCDQREHRLRVGAMAAGLRVLDGCTYSGGFALHAARGGAREVTAVDLDERALELASENAELNRLPIQLFHADIFRFLREASRAQRRFDLVIIDPPKLARGREETASALRRYKELNALAVGVLAEGGTLITCSCSGAVPEAAFEKAVLAGARSAGARLAVEERGGAGLDHPVRPEFPEGRYLKVLTLRSRPRS